jgi:hypothetical protein
MAEPKEGLLSNTDKSIEFIFSGEFPGLNDVQSTVLTAGKIPMQEPSTESAVKGAFSFARYQREATDVTSIVRREDKEGKDDGTDDADADDEAKKHMPMYGGGGDDDDDPLFMGGQ